VLVEKIPPAMATSRATSGYWATDVERLSMKSAGFTGGCPYSSGVHYVISPEPKFNQLLAQPVLAHLVRFIGDEYFFAHRIRDDLPHALDS